MNYSSCGVRLTGNNEGYTSSRMKSYLLLCGKTIRDKCALSGTAANR